MPKLQERIVRLNDFWGGRSLAQVNGETCREYVRWRGTDGGLVGTLKICGRRSITTLMRALTAVGSVFGCRRRASLVNGG